MAWKYPKHSLQREYVIEIEPINENFLSVVEETSGYLNEHNLRAHPIFRDDVDNSTPTITRDSLSNAGSMKLHVSQHNAAHSLATGTSVTLSLFGGIASRTGTVQAPQDWVALAKKDDFQTFAQAGLGVTFTATGGAVWLCASINIHCHDLARHAFTTGSTTDEEEADLLSEWGYVCPTVVSSLQGQKGYGFNVAIEVDGSIIYESLVGTGDISNEFYGTDPADTDITAPQGGGGINGAMIPVVTDAIVNLTPGQHTVRVAIMDIMASNRKATSPTFIAGRSLFALELLR